VEGTGPHGEGRHFAFHENCSGYGGEDARHALDMVEAVTGPALKFHFRHRQFLENRVSSLATSRLCKPCGSIFT